MGVVTSGGGRVRELERELARLRALYGLTSVLSRTGDLDEIFAEALRCLHATLGADRSSILLRDEWGAMRFRAWRGLSETYRNAVDGHSPWAPDDPAPSPIVVADVDEASAMAPYREAFAAEGIQSLAFIPLVARDRLLGKFMVYFAEPHHYSQSDVELALNIAQHIALAVDRSHAEAQLRRTAVILEGISDGVSVHDGAGRILYANDAAARLTGVDDGEEMMRLGGAAILDRFEMLHEDGTPFAIDQLPGHRALHEGRQTEALINFRIKADGRERWSHVRAAPVLGEDGEVAFAVNIFRDVTREQEMAMRNAQLYEAEQAARREAEAAVEARDYLLAVVSHDLRTPLTAISVAASMLEEDEERASHVRTVRQAAAAMQRLIADLLDLERLRSGTLTMDRAPHRCGDILREAVELMEPVAVSQGIALELQDADVAVTVACDRDRTRQVLSNLVSNAIKFSPAGTTVRLSARRLDDAVEVSVTDRGPGIPRDELGRIFERHFQGNPGEHGVGLGLSIAKGFVERQGGTIRVESEVDRGTTVSFTIPLA